MVATQNILKTAALQMGAKNFKVHSLKLDRVSRMNFEELLQYKLKKGRVLNFRDFHRICGISRQQWDFFRMENIDKSITWAF